MNTKITLVAMALSVFSLSTIAQQATEMSKTRSVSAEENSKPIQHIQAKAGAKIWGAEAITGTADGQFQNPFMTTNGGYSTTLWTALTINENGGSVTPGNAYWAQTMTGESQGAYWGSTPIQSPTQVNGAAIFDSDFMDNNGVPAAWGTGTSPSAHEGWLVSPRIDLSGYTDSLIAVRFWCKWREFIADNFTISFSSDDGTTWTEYSIKAALPSGGNDVEGWVTEYFTNEVAGVTNLSQCRIRFRFSGDYYYAMIDDVTIETGEAVDLTIGPDNIGGNNLGEQMYQVQIMNNRHIPISGISDPRDFTYGAVVQNDAGGEALGITFYNSDLIANIERDNSGVWTNVHSDTIEIPTFNYNTSVALADTLTDMSWATVGDYRVVYIIDHWQDENSNNDTLIEYFSINDDAYASKVQRDANGLPVMEAPVFPAGSQTTFEYGSTFDFPNIGAADVKVDSISQGFYVPNGYVGPANIIYTVRLYEWEDVNSSETIDDYTELTPVAIGTDTAVGVDMLLGTYIMKSTQLIDINNFNAGYVLQDNNKIYYASVSLEAGINGQVSFDGNSMIWVACASSVNYGMNYLYTNTKASALHLIDAGGSEVFNDFGFGVTRVPAMGLHISDNCEPITADLDFTENFLEVGFTDMSSSWGDPVNSWMWTFGDGNTSTDQNPTHTYAAPGQYEVCLTVSNSCTTETFCDSVEVEQNTSSLTENWQDALLVYPNPSDNIVRVENLPQDVYAIELRNVVGQIVYQSSIELQVGVEVSVTSIASGHYNLIVRSESGVAVKHIVVK